MLLHMAPQTHDSLLLLLLLFALVAILGPNPALSLHRRSISSVELAALAAVKNSLTDIPGSTFFSTWDFSAPDPCSSFSGVTCSLDRHVTILTLGTGLSNSPGLAGSLSPALANLTGLTQLILCPGLVTGPIPADLGRLTNLQLLSLNHNRLTGTIPSSLAGLRNLHTLDLSYNQLTGSIPFQLTAGLNRLKVLVLASNLLSGELPRFVGRPSSSQLLHLDLKNNRLNGKLPPSSFPSTLRYLSLSGNSLWGPINALLPLKKLLFLDLSTNQFSGPIPSSLFNPSLSSMFLQRNNLSGRLPQPGPAWIGSYGGGSIVDLSHNRLEGQLSVVLAGVEMLFLNNNRLTGKVPEEYVESVSTGSTRTLYLQNNYLTGFPVESGLVLPDTASLCLSYNCMEPPIGISNACPAASTGGGQVSRPSSQCSGLKDQSSLQ